MDGGRWTADAPAVWTQTRSKRCGFWVWLWKEGGGGVRDLLAPPTSLQEAALQMFQLMSTPLVIGDGNGTLGQETQEHLQRPPQLPARSFIRPPCAVCLSSCSKLVPLAADNLSIWPPDTGRKGKRENPICEVRETEANPTTPTASGFWSLDSQRWTVKRQDQIRRLKYMYTSTLPIQDEDEDGVSKS
ncbi:uncharacterized protein LY79DRAFT_570748 [Colletotrichum navitas]|uniref:Uncharacterized protein n=1 Tax=Colletotrichum navitas TaxID=681940 RepID=A0AAD8UZN6_9PEZI|nr:uncharacterized protein LY79DRAFT_570748 [Colletotrichum navitas]KAK1569974.1 hypothetical protein LY79DRAFT_570748 [Colletotrichum navitas]